MSGREASRQGRDDLQRQPFVRDRRTPGPAQRPEGDRQEVRGEDQEEGGRGSKPSHLSASFLC